MSSLIGNHQCIPGRPFNLVRDPPKGITFLVRKYSIMLGQVYPYPHQWYCDLALQGMIDCHGKDSARSKERLTICFLPYHLTPTKPLTDLTTYGGVIFADFRDISPYIDLLRNYQVMAHINESDPRFNRLFASPMSKNSSVRTSPRRS
jgi:hypothetical protein